VDNFVVEKDANGKIRTSYLVRNQGKKRITAYTVARWYSDNTGFLGAGLLPNGKTTIGPGKTAGTLKSIETNNYDSSRNGNSSWVSSSETKIIAFIMIVEITFDDGSRFSAKSLFDSLEKHLVRFERSYDKDFVK